MRCKLAPLLINRALIYENSRNNPERATVLNLVTYFFRASRRIWKKFHSGTDPNLLGRLSPLFVELPVAV